MSKKNKHKPFIVKPNNWGWGEDGEDWLERNREWYANAEERRQERRRKYEEAMNGVAQKLDRIMTNDQAVVARSASEVNIGGNIAATITERDRRTVVFDHDEIDRWARWSDERLALTLGLNLHELGHMLHSPALSTKDPLFPWLNLLEDQRQELLVTVTYPKAEDYFRLINSRALVRALDGLPGKLSGSRSELETVMAQHRLIWLLYYGRRHLFKPELVNQLLTNAISWDPILANEEIGIGKQGRVNGYVWYWAQELIDEFMRLDLRNATELAKGREIAQWFQDHFGSPTVALPSVLLRGSACLPGNGQPLEQGNEALEKVRGLPRVGARPDNKLMSDPGGELRRLIWKALDDLATELKEIERELPDDGGWSAGVGWQNQSIPLPAEDVETARKLGRMFADISRDLSLVEHRQQRRGKLDARRLALALAQESDRMFRRRQPDLKDDAALAIHVMLDSSSSMSEVITQAARIAFTVCKGAELAGHHAKLSTFASGSQTVKDWEDRRYAATINSGGGTAPKPLFEAAKPDFERLTRRKDVHNHVVAVVTDGEWGDPRGCKAVLEELQKDGAYIILVGIRTPIPTTYPSMANIEINKISDLATALREPLRNLARRITREIYDKVGLR